MALNDDMWNGRPATARPTEDLAPPQAMRRHPLQATTIFLGVAAAIFAPVLLQTDEFVALVLAGGFVGGGHAALLWTATNSSHTVTPALLARISRSAAVGSVVAVAGGCLYPSIGVLGAVLTLAGVLSVPYLLRRFTPQPVRLPVDRPEAPVQQRLDLPAPPLARRSTVEIAAAWSASHELLRRTPSADGRARIAGLRQAYLDELERRDAEGVGRWLRSGHALDSDVAGYLATRDQDDPEAERP